MALVLAGAAPAVATHQPNHAGTGVAAITENSDSDGVANNIPDEGDNLHPSGKDRSVESGGSGDQGQSASTPDQNGRGPERDNGGTDKPNGPGGADIIDQDRNNGCGNDDDFDDDNEGLCGKVKDRTTPEKGEKPQSVLEQESGKPGEDDETPPLGVAAGQAQGSQPAAGAVGGVVVGQPGAPPSGQVLGEVIVQGVSGGNVLATTQGRDSGAGALATTGAGFFAVLLLAVGLILAGTVLAYAGRGRSRSFDR
jgi:hypothetical protein